MDSQIISLWLCSFDLHLRKIMNLPFHPSSVGPSTNLSSSHLPHTETRQWGPHPSSVFSTFSPSLGHSFHTGAPISVFCTSFPHLFIIFCTNTFYYQSLLLSSLRATYFPFGHPQPMSPLVGALLPIYPRRHRLYLQSTTQVTYLYSLNLFTLSHLWHNLSLILSSP
jgi:hypothetical protein